MVHDRVLGIDVSKAQLDICEWPNGEAVAFPNDESGWAAVAARAAEIGAEAIALEASGGFERAATRYLRECGLLVLVLDPRRVRLFAAVRGKTAKNDRLDAATTAQFAALFGEERPARGPELERLAEFLTYYEQCADSLAHARTRAGAFAEPELCARIAEEIARLKMAKVEVLRRLRQLVKRVPGLPPKIALLQSMPGIGFLNAVTLAVRLPELGTLSRHAIAALAGVAPYDRDSGSMRGQRHIHGGRARVRRMLYMGALLATRSGSPFAQRYAALLRAGKPTKVALVAVMRKMIVTLNAMLRDGRSWTPAIA